MEIAGIEPSNILQGGCPLGCPQDVKEKSRELGKPRPRDIGDEGVLLGLVRDDASPGQPW